MNENLKKFLEEAGKNKELKSKLEALTDKNTLVTNTIEIAKEHGFHLTPEDFETPNAEEMSPDELDAVAGGGWKLPLCVGASGGKDCMCIFIGAAPGCGCVIIGTN